MSMFRGVLSLAAIYFMVIGTLLIGAALGLMKVVETSAGVAVYSEREKTQLDLRVESAREIREALAKPIPLPEPLPPMAAKFERATPTVAAVAPKRPTVLRQARAAFASMRLEQSSHSAMAFDRHMPQ